MATVPVANTAEVHLRGVLDGQQVENTFFYELGSAIDQAALDTLTEAFAAYVLDNWIPVMSPAFTGREVYARDMTSGSGLQSTDATIFGEVGGLAGNPLPNNVTIAVARKSGLAGRSFAGRIFWMGLTDAQQDAVNFIANTSALGILALLEGLDAEITGLGWLPVVVSLFTGGAPRVAGVTTPITTWLITDFALDARRRRLVGRGS